MIPLGTVFRSGTNHAGEIEGTLRAGFQVGVSVCELNVEAVRTLRDCAQAHPEALRSIYTQRKAELTKPVEAPKEVQP